MFASISQCYPSPQRQLRAPKLVALVLCVLPLHFKASAAPEISIPTTESRTIGLNPDDLEGACPLDGNQEAGIFEATSSTNETDTVADRRCLPLDAVSESKESANEPPASNADELIARGTFAMTNGLQFSNHVKQFVRLVQAVHQDKDGPNARRERQRQAADALTSKWSSIHAKAVHSLREAFDLFREASETQSASSSDLEAKLRQVRESLVELHSDKLYPPSSVPLPTHHSTVVKI